MTDSELKKILLACKEQDAASQKALYKHFYNYGMTVCARYAQNREEAREILNDSFIKAFKKIDRYNIELSFKAWLNRILVNTSIDYYRKSKTKPQTVDIIHARHYETQATVIHDLSAREILKLVQKLPPSYRLVFNLFVVEGYTHPEISEKIGISVGTSKSNLAKARSKLKSMLNNLDTVERYG